jgi:hypothetical protein
MPTMPKGDGSVRPSTPLSESLWTKGRRLFVDKMDVCGAAFRKPRQLISGLVFGKSPIRIALPRSGGALLFQSVSELPRNVFIWRRQRPLRHCLAHGRHQDIVLLKPFERPRAIEIRQCNRHIHQNAGVVANMNRT